ncbi:hypothetical protein [Salana multivorans]
MTVLQSRLGLTVGADREPVAVPGGARQEVVADGIVCGGRTWRVQAQPGAAGGCQVSPLA